jgi:hypothetical protein
MKWQWSDVYGTAEAMLQRMQEACNKHGEATGHGEKEIDPTRLVY